VYVASRGVDLHFPTEKERNKIGKKGKKKELGIWLDV
jgi:hypothetical protein